MSHCKVLSANCRRADRHALQSTHPSAWVVPPLRCIRLRANLVEAFSPTVASSPCTVPRRSPWCPGSCLARAASRLGPARAAARSCSRLAVIADFNEVPLPNGAALRRWPAARADHAGRPRPAAGAARRRRPDRRRRASCAASRSSAPGNLANVAAYGWEASPRAALLAAVGCRRPRASTRCRGCCWPASSCASSTVRRPGHLRPAVPRPARSSACRGCSLDTIPPRW